MLMFGLKSASYCTHSAATAASCHKRVNHNQTQRITPQYLGSIVDVLYLIRGMQPMEKQFLSHVLSPKVSLLDSSGDSTLDTGYGGKLPWQQLWEDIHRLVLHQRTLLHLVFTQLRGCLRPHKHVFI